MTQWETVSCWGCGGHGLVTSTYTGEPTECRSCDGSGTLWASEKGAVAKWPGGPFAGKLTKEETSAVED